MMTSFVKTNKALLIVLLLAAVAGVGISLMGLPPVLGLFSGMGIARLMDCMEARGMRNRKMRRI